MHFEWLYHNISLQSAAVNLQSDLNVYSFGVSVTVLCVPESCWAVITGSVMFINPSLCAVLAMSLFILVYFHTFVYIWIWMIRTQKPQKQTLAQIQQTASQINSDRISKKLLSQDAKWVTGLLLYIPIHSNETSLMFIIRLGPRRGLRLFNFWIRG